MAYEKNEEPCLIFAHRSGGSQFGAASAPLRNLPAMPRFYADKLARVMNAESGSPNLSYTVEAA